MSGQETLRLIQGEEIYIFRYFPGHEKKVIERVREMVKNPEIKFDGKDAYVVEMMIRKKMQRGEESVY